MPVRAADAPAAAQLTITAPDGTTAQPVPLAGLAGREDVHDVRYTVRAADGGTSEVTVHAGFSLGLLLREAGVELDGFTYLEVPRADGTSVLVLRDQIVGVEEGEPPPVVWADAEGVHFLRPSAGEDDVNADDLVTLPDGALALRLQSGEPFAVRIEASAQRVKAKQPVRFEVVLVAGTRTPDMDFQWYFADGSPDGDGVRVTHRFRARGTYLVQVNVVKSGRTLDAHDVLAVRVHAPVPPSAPTGEGVGTGGGAGADSGSDEPAVVSPYGGGTPATGGYVPPAPPPTPRAPRQPRHKRPPAPTTFSASQGELVSGTLLASADTVPLPAGANGSSGRARGATDDQPLHVPVGVWLGALLAVLLVAGWTLESRHIPPFWQP